MIKLSNNFTLKELTKTSQPYPNKPTLGAREKLFYLCQFILQPIRDKFGTIIVTSGYRSEEINQAIGGSATSQHMKGEATDIVPTKAGIKTVFEWIVDNLQFGQAIHEKKKGKEWIHLSLPRLAQPAKNQQALIYDGSKYSPWERS